MPNKKISELSAAGALAGTELVEVVKGGVNVQTTTQDIADLGGGGGTWGSITGTLSSQTDLQNALNDKSDAGATVSAKVGAYTLLAADLTLVNAGATLIIDGDSSADLTVPLNATIAFPVGSFIGVRDFNNVVATGGVTITGTSGSLAIPSGMTATLEKTGTDTWILHNGGADSAETTTTIGALINGATAKTTPVDADMVGLMDSAASNILKKLSWANIKATLKTYFDTLFEPILTSATPSTAGATITLDMNSLTKRMFVGSASFATSKTLALSNATNALIFNFHFEVTDVAATLVCPSTFKMSTSSWNESTDTWTPPAIGLYEMGGSFDGTNWKVKVVGPFV